MIIIIALMAYLIYYYKQQDKKIAQYTPVTAYVTHSEYDFGRRKNVGGSYRTTVKYLYNGMSYEQQLKYNTPKVCLNEAIDCLVNPEMPEQIYPVSAAKSNRTMVAIGWFIIVVLILTHIAKYGLILFRW